MNMNIDLYQGFLHVCFFKVASSDEMEKLSKLITLWTSKNKFFSEETLDQMKNPGNSLTKYKADLADQFRSVVEEVIINLNMLLIIVISM